MDKVRWQKILRSTFLLFTAIVLALAPSAVSALSDALLDRYAENNILFYDPDASDENCAHVVLSSNGNFSIIYTAKNADKQYYDFLKPDGDNVAKWSDSSTESMKNLLEAYGDLAYQLGSVVGAPYIAILVQMRYEDPNSKCGTNNFWGNGCPDGSPDGSAGIQGSNLGEGFAQYGETLLGGNHDQAIGISDPKAYLEAIGPTWVQGDITGAGYAQINAMKKSVDALQSYINSTEGQAIVSTFSSAGAVISSGSDNQSAVYGYLIDSGYTETAAAAIMGNLLNESSAVNPKLLEGGSVVDDDFVAYKDGQKTFSGGFGIAQWTSPGRVANLQSYADSLNLKVTSLEVQAKFLAKEINDYGFGPDILNNYSLEEATYIIYKQYESPGVSLSLPKSYSDFIASYTSGSGYDEYIERLSAAQEALGLTPSSISSSNICSNSSSSYAYTGEFPHYLQCDERWGKLMYGSGGINGTSGTSICDSGCGPSSFAMMATALLGRTITPADTADVAGKANMHVAGAGSSHEITTTLANYYGLQSKRVVATNSTDAIEQINALLSDGWMIHTSGSGSLPFSSGGHYIGIHAITNNGKWLLADSGHSSITPNDEYDPSAVFASGMRLDNIWAIKK